MKLDLVCKNCGESLNYERVGNTDYYACYKCNSSDYQKPETIKVRIVSCSNPVWWYADKIGETYEVIKTPEYTSDYQTLGIADDGFVGLIAKKDAIELSDNSIEDMLVSLSQKVAALTNENRNLKKDLRRFAAMSTEADYKAGKALELIKTGEVVDCKCQCGNQS